MPLLIRLWSRIAPKQLKDGNASKIIKSNMKNEEIIVAKEKVTEIYEDKYHETPLIEVIDSGGSERIYLRLYNEEGETIIAVYGKNIPENESFVNLSQIFHKEGVSVPYAKFINEDRKIYFQEDLGNVSLFSLFKKRDVTDIIEKTVSGLIKIQTVDYEKWKDFVFNKTFGRRLIMWDLNYFKYCFLKPLEIIFDEENLEDEFELLSRELLEEKGNPIGFMYRDFQSRNIMVKDDEPWLIDFQGGRKGPLLYDIVSFLWQAKAGFDTEERKRYSDYYLKELRKKIEFDINDAEKKIKKFALFRTFQVLGAYGFRGLMQRKQHFIESIPQALNNLRLLKEEGFLNDYPELYNICKKLLEINFDVNTPSDVLTVKVTSFSFMKGGYPQAENGNGGGFVFDCRGMYNPGRHEEYKKLTGKDKEVKDFLEDKGEVQEFVKKAVDITAPTIRNYKQRGFNSLQVSFGCTGGRHRSVYCAEDYALRIRNLFPEINTVIVHREIG